MLNCKERIREIIKTREIDILSETLTSFSKYINYSNAAVIKSLKQIGYIGWKDFQSKYYLEKIENLKKIEDMSIESIISTRRALFSNQSFLDLIDRINILENIAIQGIGSNRELCIYFKKQLEKLNIKSNIIEFKEDLIYDNKMIIIFSDSWKSILTQEVFNEAKKRKMETATITYNTERVPHNLDYVIEGIMFSSSSSLNSTKFISFYIIDKIIEQLQIKRK